MSDTRTYPHGVPSWIDTVAPDLDESKRFYAGLFDWTSTHATPAEAPGNYLVADDRRLGTSPPSAHPRTVTRLGGARTSPSTTRTKARRPSTRPAAR